MSFLSFNDLPSEIYDRSRYLDSSYVGFYQTPFKPTILITDPALVEKVLIKDFSYFQDHGFDVDIENNPLAGHLFNLKGDQWRTLRHKLVPTFTSGKLRGMVPIMEKCADKLIQEIKQDLSLQKDTDLKELFKKYSLAVIDLTDELLTAQVFVFLLAGFENVAYLIAIVMHQISKYPNIQKRLREEVGEVISRHRKVDYQAIRDMKLLEACIDETLRLYPPQSILMRGCNKTYNLDDGNNIEKGMDVILPIKSIHLDSKYWTDPEEFNPDRFINNNYIRPGTDLPFGDGPRICIAQRMALIVTKLMLAKLLVNFDMTPSPKTKEPIKINILVGANVEGGLWGSFKNLDQ